MNMQTNTPNVIKSLDFPIGIIVKFQTTLFLKLLCFNTDEEIESNLIVNNEIRSQSTRTNNQMSIL